MSLMQGGKFTISKTLRRAIGALYVALLVIMAAATFVENALGVSFAHRSIYGAWWFTALWAMLAASGAAYIVLRRERRLPVLLLHVSFLIILAGALLSHIFARSGHIHLRMGERQRIVLVEHNGHQYYHRLNFSVTLTDFKVVEDEEGRVVDYVSRFSITDRNFPPHDSTSSTTHTPQSAPSSASTPPTTSGEVSMNRIFRLGRMRFYQASYDSDLLGSTLIINRDPYGIPVTYAGYALLLISFLWLCLRRLPAWRIWLFGGALTVAWCLHYFVLDGTWTQIPVLRSPLLFVHVTLIIMSYSLLVLQVARSTCRLLRKEKTVDDAAILRFALCLLAIGIFLGAVWANISWGNYWSWDSKEVWALITMMLYAIPMHRASLPVFRRPTVWHAYILLAFLAVLMTYFGVSYLLTGLHSYN